LDNLYTIDNSVKLAHDLTKLKISNSHRLNTLDIKDLYFNIPILETIDISRTQLLKHNNKNTTEQICKLLKMVLQQNYFAFQEQIFQPTKGVAMRSPISGITAEIFLQHLEQSYVRSLLDSKHITFYARYVDDILIIYDASRTNTDTITQYSISTHRKLQLNPKLVAKDRVNFLDLSIIRKASQIEIDVFRKPTTTVTIVSFLSIHPGEHKIAAYRYYIERMFNFPSIMTDFTMSGKPSSTLQKNNKFPNTLPHKLKHQVEHRIMHVTPGTNAGNNTKWATFTFTSPQIRKITNFFKHTNVKIAFRCNNTIARLTKPPNVHKIPPHNKWGIYQLTCNCCNLTYVGQTNQNLKIRYR